MLVCFLHVKIYNTEETNTAAILVSVKTDERRKMERLFTNNYV
jgi:hypothetical protein